MKNNENLNEREKLETSIEKLKTEHAKLERKIAEWILRRKVEAGAITASGLEQLDKAVHACNVVKQVVDDIKKTTVLLAEATKLPRIAELICETRGEKYDKQVLRDLENADAVSKNAVIFLLQVKDIIIDADLKLKSTGWLSDRPPEIQKSDFLSNNQEAKLQNKTSSSNKAIDQMIKTPKTESNEETSAALEILQEDLKIVRNQKRNLKSKMAQRRHNIHTSESEKAERHRFDVAKLKELDTKIQELVENIENVSGINDPLPQSSLRAPTPKDIYAKATLRNTPVDEAMPDEIAISANF